MALREERQRDEQAEKRRREGEERQRADDDREQRRMFLEIMGATLKKLQ